MGPLRDYAEVAKDTVSITNSMGEETGFAEPDPAALSWYYSLAETAEKADPDTVWLPYLVTHAGRYYLDLVFEVVRSVAENYDEASVPAAFAALDEEGQYAVVRKAAETAARQLTVMPTVQVLLGRETGFRCCDELVLRFGYPMTHRENVSTAVDTLRGLPVYGD